MKQLEESGSHRSTRTAPVLYGTPQQPNFHEFLKVEEPFDRRQNNLFVEYLHLLARRRGTILILMIVGGFLGFCTTVGKLPVYRARTSLDIQSLNSDFMNRRAVAPTENGGDASGESYVQTQIKLLQSDTLRARTVAALEKSGTVRPFERQDLISRLRRMAHAPEPGELSATEVLHFAAAHVSVKPLGVTRLVEVTCDSWDPHFSSEFCNAFTREFAVQEREVRWAEAQKTSAWLSRQLADVADSLSKSEKKLEAATGDDALVLSEQGSTVAQEKLRELQSELMKAQADRVARQSQYEISTSAPSDSLSNVLDSGPMREQQARLADLERQVAALVPPLTEENPKVQHLRAQIREVQATLSGMKGNELERLRNEFEAAKHRETLLSAAYNEQERRVSRVVGRQNQVSLLRHEVDSSQQLYQTLLQRVKEAGFASAMQVSTIRVVDAADVPNMPVAPRATTSALVGLILGCLCAVGAAFMSERTQTALRAPGDVSRYLQLRELGVIPSARHNVRGASGTAIASPESSRLLAAPSESSTENDKENLIRAAGFQAPTSLLVEAYRNTTYSVLRASTSVGAVQTYVVTSPNSGDGKTSVTCNLGMALAQTNRRVLLIDGDLRRPRLHKATGVENTFGLRNMLRRELDLSSAPEVFSQETSVKGLYVLPSGSGHEEPSNLIHSSALPELLRMVARRFDIVLIDTPPVSHIADARIFAGMADGVILVFRARSTNREMAMNTRDVFLGDNVEVIGTILNDFDPAKEGRSNYYSSYYEYQVRGADQGAMRRG